MHVIHRSIAIAILFCSACLPAAAQVPAPAADGASVDTIVAALYDTISGPAGAVRDWARLRSLFAPGGHMVSVRAEPDGGFAARNMSVDDYIARATPQVAKMPFYEKEAARTTDTFGQIAHVFSTYESRHAPGDAKPFQRGINSIQLFSDGKRWWIVSVVWRAEDDKLPLPDRYLHNGAQ